ncbi:endolytic transglycosylase MltG [Streptomyces sp. HC44]|uniref:Endolytic murein transglycosylase n=1 Tax=Streptomyces scabichelini TaxID=2711217 RepID=A0A6G4VBT1_9ACTN|nr:endolytic transglycosylase MltG [Streptomyces scabichelini]NGO11549.1 endolytic transglycosylase MltG [Streptomyces scabichelini]
MTEYGRGQGSEPWHPEDPLFGDGGWEGQQGQAAQSSYGGQQQHYSQQPQQQHNQYGDWGTGQQAGYDQGQQHHAQGQQQYGGQDPHQYHDQNGQYQDQSGQYHGQGGHGYPDQNGQQYNGGWDTGQQGQGPYGADPGDPYGGQQSAYGGQQPDYYGTPDAYPPPQPPSRRQAEREPEPRTDWDPGPDQGEHAFFAGGGDDDDDFDDDPSDRKRGKGKGKGKGGKKRRSGCACLVVTLVFAGGIGGAGYFGYQFYQDRFGEAPDFAGDGTSQTVMVEIDKGSGGYEIGQKLKAAGVVKSVDAFVSAQSDNPEGQRIQAGVYLLNKEMSAESAVNLMLDPKSQNNMIVAPGQRNNAVYAAIDKRLELDKGTTANVAKKEYKSLGLPDWANSNDDIKDPLEGFLYPHTYAAAKGMKPEDVLKKMVAQAKAKYTEYDLEAKAEELKLDNPLQVVTVASLVQAEGKTSDDYRKMAEVVYNRLDLANPETYGALQFDSTFNYLKNESNIDISESEIKSNKDPYNTYTNKGLPPGPIGNPGDVAMKATLDPTDDGWYYFVATDGVAKTEFAKTHDEFQKLKDKFNERSGG